MADGYLNKCIDCTKKDVKDRRFNPIFREQILAYDRARGCRQTSKDLEKYRSLNPKKYLAHKKINSAVKAGLIKKECCQICGKTKVHAHHDDYNYPLSVRWLCVEHHKQWHMENGEGKV